MKSNKEKNKGRVIGRLKNNQIRTYTIDYGKKRILYYIRPHFEKVFDIDKRTLMRYRNKITQTIPDNQHYLYFIKHKGMYCYSVNILTLKTYKKGIKHTTISPSQLQVDFTSSKMDSLDSSLYNALLSIPWNYIGGANSKSLEASKCVANMKGLYCEIEKDLPKSKITLYYTTEFKEGYYHSHFSLSLLGEKNKSVINRLRKCVNRVIGTNVPFIEEYKIDEGYLEYMTEEVDQNPDGWGIITNSIKEYERLAVK